VRGGTPLARVLGLGSAKHGAHHWWVERVTGFALIPLGVWLTVSLLTLADFSHAAVTGWIAHGWTASLLLLTLLTCAWHSRLGVQVVIEDYVHGKLAQPLALKLSTIAHVLLGAAGVFAALTVAFRG
jgi:succinate dehydrogenase / fumarate reductase membrane anchor subunit